jgi:signal transduction histidine kinase
MRAVRLHNGTIEARNVAPGLRVTIDLPAACALNSSSPRLPAQPPR